MRSINLNRMLCYLLPFLRPLTLLPEKVVLTARKLSVQNKILIYKPILKPVWLYGIQLWGCFKKSTIEMIHIYNMRSSTAFAVFRISTANILCPASQSASFSPLASIICQISPFQLCGGLPLFQSFGGGSNSGPSLATSLLPFVGYDHIYHTSLFFSMVVIISWSTFMISRIFSFLKWCSLETLLHFFSRNPFQGIVVFVGPFSIVPLFQNHTLRCSEGQFCRAWSLWFD